VHQRVIISALALAALASMAGCAPDAIRSAQATGFNGYVNTLKTACPNIQIGASNVGLWLQYGGGTTNDYDYWLDMTSKLYYRRVSPAEYRSAVGAQLGPGTSNDRAFDCIIGQLPPPS
jgi:hypothetical protein